MPEKENESGSPFLSDRMQFLFGTLISIVLLVGYLALTGEREVPSDRPGGDADRQEAPAVTPDPG